MRHLVLVLVLFFVGIGCQSRTEKVSTVSLEQEKQDVINKYKAESERVEKLGNSAEDPLSPDIPRTLDEAMKKLAASMAEEDKKKLKESDPSDMGSLHFGLGMGLRNGWRLWGGSRIHYFLLSRGISHPDNMSSVIMESFVKFLRGDDYRLPEEKENPDLAKAFDAIILEAPDKLEKLLKKEPALVKQKNSIGVSLLRVAVMLCNKKAADLLMAHGASINETRTTRPKSTSASDDAPTPFPALLNIVTERCLEIAAPILSKVARTQKLPPDVWVSASMNKGLVAKMCPLLRSVTDAPIERMLTRSIASGNYADVQCLYEKVPKPFAIPFLEMTTPREKENALFMIEHLSPPNSPESIKKMAEDKAIYLPIEALDAFLKKFNVTKDMLDGSLVLFRAAQENNPDKIELLIKRGLPMNMAASFHGWLPFHAAVESCSFRAVDYYLDHGVDLNKGDESGQSAIWQLFYNPCFNRFDQELMARYLIVKGLDLNKEPGFDPAYPPPTLMQVVERGSLDFIKFLQRWGVHLYLKKTNALLVKSIDNRDPEVFKFILSLGYDINALDNEGLAAIHMAALRSDKDKVALLLGLKVDPNIVARTHFRVFLDETGLTPLHAALAGFGFAGPDHEVVSLLLTHGADPYKKNEQGLNALQLAEKILAFRVDRESKPQTYTSRTCKDNVCTEAREETHPPRGESEETRRVKKIVDILKEWERKNPPSITKSE